MRNVKRMEVIMNGIFVVVGIAILAAIMWFIQWKLPTLHPLFRNTGLRGLIRQWNNLPSKDKQSNREI
jgi:hypothetical protein